MASFSRSHPLQEPIPPVNLSDHQAPDRGLDVGRAGLHLVCGCDALHVPDVTPSRSSGQVHRLGQFDGRWAVGFFTPFSG